MAQKPGGKTLLEPGWFMSPFGGIDRLYFDSDPGFKKGGKGALKPHWEDRKVRTDWLLDWLRYLYDHSNFHFTGVYLNANGDATLLMKGSMITRHNWTPNIPHIEKQGWGIWMIYQGYAKVYKETIAMFPDLANVNIPPDWETTKVRRGVAAGNHIKDIVSRLPGDHAGTIVYLDNEIGPLEPLLPYYQAMYDEMQTDRNDGRPALRPGIYVRAGFINTLLKQTPDLFVWFVEHYSGDMPKVKEGTPWSTPIKTVHTPEGTDYQRYVIQRYPMTQDSLLYVPVGRQCTLHSASKTQGQGLTISTISSSGEGKKASIDGWDFNVSFVRDPSYPIADPRFMCDSTIVYSAWGKSAVTTREFGSREIPMQGTEPEAPLLRVDVELYSIDKDANVVMTTKNTPAAGSSTQTRNAWDPVTIVVPAGNLRRMRAFSVLKSSPKETILVYVSNHHQLQVYRRYLDANKPAKWTASGVWDVGTALHQFTNISTVLFRDKVWLFFMQGIPNDTLEGSLTVAQWKGTTQQLGKGLKGSAIATVATNNYLFVFTIGKDHQLYYAYAYGDDQKLTWTLLKPAGDPNLKEMCHPHTKMSAYVIDPTHVKVAIMSDDGIPAVFPFFFADPVWGSATSKEFPVEESQAPRSQGLVAANGWTVNPYGDIALVRNRGSTDLYCAGCAPDQRGILLRRIDAKNEPWFRLDDEGTRAFP